MHRRTTVWQRVLGNSLLVIFAGLVLSILSNAAYDILRSCLLWEAWLIMLGSLLLLLLVVLRLDQIGRLLTRLAGRGNATLQPDSAARPTRGLIVLVSQRPSDAIDTLTSAAAVAMAHHFADNLLTDGGGRTTTRLGQPAKPLHS